MAAFHQMAGHRPPHDADPDEPDLPCLDFSAWWNLVRAVLSARSRTMRAGLGLDGLLLTTRPTLVAEFVDQRSTTIFSPSLAASASVGESLHRLFLCGPHVLALPNR